MPLGVGKVITESRSGSESFVWKIEGFFTFPQNIQDYPIVSPSFPALGAQWWLGICPLVNSHGVPHIELQLRKSPSTPARYVSYTVSIRGRDGVVLMADSGEKNFTEYDTSMEYREQTHLSQQDRDLWAPCGTLTVFLHLREREALCRAEEPGELERRKTSSCPAFYESYTVGIQGKNDVELMAGSREKDFIEYCNSEKYCERTYSTQQPNRDLWSSCGTLSVFHHLPEIEAPFQAEALRAQCIPWKTDKYTRESDAGPSKSCNASSKDVGVQTDDFDEHSEVGQCKITGSDVATQMTDEDIENSEEESHDVEETPENPSGTWQTKISQLYDTKECSDVRFVVDGHIFEAHRLVLAIRSPKFRRLLTSANAAYETHIVEEENITAAAFDTFLRFLYKDILETTDKRLIIEIYRCALNYQVQDLLENCEKEMSTWDISPDDVCTLLDCGLDVPVLTSRCTDTLRREGQTVLSSPAFLQISFRTLHFMLESGALENVPVLQRIERTLEWYKHRHPDEANYADARNKLLGDATNSLMGRLGLENLGLKELSYVVTRYQGLITPEELVNFLRYGHSRNKSVLPDWCLLAPSE